MPSSTISVELQKTTFSGGEIVRGVAHLHIHRPLESREVCVSVVGKEESRWEESNGRTTSIVRNEHKCVNLRTRLVEVDRVLPTGEYHLPFAVQLPAYMLPSFYHQIYVSTSSRRVYKVTAKVDVKGWFDLVNKTVITVRRTLPQVPPATIAMLSVPLVQPCTKKFWLARYGYANTYARVRRQMYSPGQTIGVDVYIDNTASRKRCRTLVVSLFRLELWKFVKQDTHAKNPSICIESEEINDAAQAGMASTHQVRLTIPQGIEDQVCTVPLTKEHPQNQTIAMFMVVRVLVEYNGASECCAELPILIVPRRELGLAEIEEAGLVDGTTTTTTTSTSSSTIVPCVPHVTECDSSIVDVIVSSKQL